MERTTRWDRFTLTVPRAVYEPAEDSFLLADAARGHATRGHAARRALDVGTGSGLTALALAASGAHVVATDRNPAAVTAARENARANGLAVAAVRTDLAAGVRGPFDVVAFNPPYLPPEQDAAEGEYEHALTGGPTGAETAIRLVQDLPRLLAPAGVALLLTSSRGNEAAVLAAADAAGFDAVAAGEARFFFERLTVWEMRWRREMG